MSSAIVNDKKKRPPVAEVLAAFSEALDVFEYAVEAFSHSITKERGGDYDLLQSLRAAQKIYGEAAAPATGFNGREAKELWERARKISAAAREAQERSKRFYNLYKQRRAAHAEWAAQTNGHRTSGPEPILSIPEYLGKERPKKGRHLSPAAEKRQEENRKRAHRAGLRASGHLNA